MKIKEHHILYERGKLIYNCKFPRWKDLPDEPLMRKAMLDYIETQLLPLFPDGKVLTGTMVQNYIKWGLVPRPQNRKYGKAHIVYFTVLTLLKEVIEIKNVHIGIYLQTRLMTLPEAYDSFCTHLEESLRRVSAVLRDDISPHEEVHVEGLTVKPENLNLAFLCAALAFKFMSELFISQKGFMGALLENQTTS